jgi:hypothetical protein
MNVIYSFGDSSTHDFKLIVINFVLACLILCNMQPVYASVIDFETVPGATPADKLAISTQYQGLYGVTFSLSDGGTPYLEKTGSSDSGDGFRNDVNGNFHDIEDPEYAGQLGNYFLRLGTVGLETAPAPILIIAYDTPVSAASAEIWDIDGTSASNTEQWKVTAHNDVNDVIATIISPLGSTDGVSSLDGEPWIWSFNRASSDIYSIQVEFIGGKTNNIGLAFDNFSPATSAVPIPATVWLFGSGLLGLVGIARRNKAA